MSVHRGRKHERQIQSGRWLNGLRCLKVIITRSHFSALLPQQTPFISKLRFNVEKGRDAAPFERIRCTDTELMKYHVRRIPFYGSGMAGLD